LSIKELLKLYREHRPDISLYPDAQRFLSELAKKNIPAGLITDGRSITQRNKLASLGIKNYFRDIIISEEFGSEKPDSRNYEYFVKKYPNSSFCFIGDNTTKDFIIPKKLGWTTVCIADKGNNIHSQRFNGSPVPQHIVSSFNDIIIK
jgi:putative hydrolase of the HAD superfamily